MQVLTHTAINASENNLNVELCPCGALAGQLCTDV